MNFRVFARQTHSMWGENQGGQTEHITVKSHRGSYGLQLAVLRTILSRMRCSEWAVGLSLTRGTIIGLILSPLRSVTGDGLEYNIKTCIPERLANP